MNRRDLIGAALGGLALATLALPVQAAETTLSALNFLPPNNIFSKPFLEWIEMVNTEGKGLVKIDVRATGSIGIPNMGNAVKSGVVDIVHMPSTFYKSSIPAVDAINYLGVPEETIRKNGGFELYAKLHAEKLNVHYLGHWGTNIPFYLYLSAAKTPPEGPKGLNLADWKIRISPLNRGVFRDLGAVLVQMPPNEIFTAMERNMVDGLGYPAWDIESGGWAKFVKWRVEVPFYNTQQGLLINLDKWKGLSADQQAVLTRNWRKIEAQTYADAVKTNAEQKALQEKIGVKPLKLSDAATKALLDTAYAAGWAEVIQADPDNGPKLKALFYK
jgi:TRAP-type C4-dicarboxylate transport system substrate-binding protein